MPYISAQDQEQFNTLANEIDNADIKTAGELNFLLTKLAVRYLEVNGHRYKSMNDIVGALVAAKDEFTRRVVAPYEAQKAYEVEMVGLDPYQKSAP